jgi:putative ABC transport system permease protein
VWFVLLAVGLLVLIVLLVILKAWRIANENPVQSIKSE